MSLDEKFNSACEKIKKFSKRPPDAQVLDIYGLYKQATMGDVNICVKTTDPIAKNKWEAWNANKGMKSTTAKEKYVEMVSQLATKYEK